MEAAPSRRADGDCSGRQGQQHLTAEPSLGSCPPQQPQQPPSHRPLSRATGRAQNRWSRRSDLLRLQQRQAAAWQHSDSLGPSGSSFLSTTSPSPTSSLPSTSSTPGELAHRVPTHSSQEGLESVSSPRKGEKKPPKPGKYACTYCGRLCAKPSVLQKHIRSHTGERPYPCDPCGFAFKTKSNLYKHRKSRAHRIKAGLASSRDEPGLSGPEGGGVGEDLEEHSEGESTESEEETGQHEKPTAKELFKQQKKRDKLHHGVAEENQKPEDTQAIKQRLALRLSERKRGPMVSPDDQSSSLSTSSCSLGPGSKGSTESGYYSGSGSTELSQVSPPSASAKTYAEIILGKYGRVGGQQRSPHQQQPHSSHASSSGTEEKNLPFAMPKTQVIEHITKLITINEAVVDTSEIDSVKPRRSSLSRKNSMESPKFLAPRDPYAIDPKGEATGPRGARNPEVDPLDTTDSSAVPFYRSHSMPSSTGQTELLTSETITQRGHRLCQSFDEQQALEMRGAQRTLRRQPAIEVPIGAEAMLEGAGQSPISCMAQGDESSKHQEHQQRGHGGLECGACGVCLQTSEAYETHRSRCREVEDEEADASKTSKEDRPLMMHHRFRALAMVVRKRRKEESLEEDPPSPGPVPVSGITAGLASLPGRYEHNQANSGVTLPTEPNKLQQQERKGVSVIQHTSSFEKQESVSMESHEPGLRETKQAQAPEPKTAASTSRLIRQPNIQVPEILVTVEVDPDVPSESTSIAPLSTKEAEKPEEFQWPQRSQTLAQLPTEKLPPKKKRLRLAEAAQSSGGSSFESMSMPRSPSQESNISSHSTSFEDTARSEANVWGSVGQNSQMLMVPAVSHQHQQSHKEMRRSASEQAPASPQQSKEISETRSKSFDYGSLSPQQSTTSWEERRKCLLIKPTPTELECSSRAESPKPGPSYPSHLSVYSAEGSTQLCQEETGMSLQVVPSQILPAFQDSSVLQQRGQYALISGLPSHSLPVTTAMSEALSTQVIRQAFLHAQTGASPIPIQSPPLHFQDQTRAALHHLPPLVPLHLPSGNRALYFSLSPQLAACLPSLSPTESRSSVSPTSTALARQSIVTISYHPPRPVIATCLAQFTPVVSLVVPVRLQAHRPAFASAMYTTLSQILASAPSQEPVSCTAMVIMSQMGQEKLQRTYLRVPSQEIKSLLPLCLPPELPSSSSEMYGPMGAGGSKRMLSPAASLELSTEAQRHQKRVKEEEGQYPTLSINEKVDVRVAQEEKPKDAMAEAKESKGIDSNKGTLGKAETKRDQALGKDICGELGGDSKLHKKLGQTKDAAPMVGAGVERPSALSFPSLHTSTSVNWCYLKYVKPNPSTQRDARTSVYSTWSVSAHNPNLPGFSTKVALSLLCSKQKHCSETYTMATAPTPAKVKLCPASHRTPHFVSEVCATSPCSLTEVKTKQKLEKEESKESKKEEAPSTSRQGGSSRSHVFEGGFKSNEEYVYVRGRGRGKYICGECGIRCKKPSMLKKHIRTHTDVRPYVCKHCNFAFKTKGNLTKHMKSKAHGKKCQAMGISESSLDEPESEETGSEERACGSEEQEEHQFSDVEESDNDNDDEDDEDEEEEEESASHEDPQSSCSSDTHPSTGGRSGSSRLSHQGTPESEPHPGLEREKELSPRGLWPGRRAASPGSRRALFSRRGWKASPRTFSPSSESCSPSRSLSPRLELSSPIRSLSPRTDLSTPSRHVSPSPERGPSPIRALSPLHPASPGCCFLPSQGRTPPSPLRLQHRAPVCLPWESPAQRAGHARKDKGGTAVAETPWFSSALLRLSTCETYPSTPASDPTFSHLPMHSQQAKVPYLMIPIGGIQMVQARPRSHPTTPSSPTSPSLEGPPPARFDLLWGGTPRTPGPGSPGDGWSARCGAGTAETTLSSVEWTDSKFCGSSVHAQSSAALTGPPGASTAPAIQQQPGSKEWPPGGDRTDRESKGDSDRADQST